MKRIGKGRAFTHIALLLGAFSFASWQIHDYLIPEPPVSQAIEWNLEASGLLRTAYDLNGNGHADYHTLRVVRTHFFSVETLEEVLNNFKDNRVFFVPYTISTYYYITAMNPLYYAVDVNEDGHWDLLFKDNLEDGVNGNEEFYGSPSLLFGLPDELLPSS